MKLIDQFRTGWRNLSRQKLRSLVNYCEDIRFTYGSGATW